MYHEFFAIEFPFLLFYIAFSAVLSYNKFMYNRVYFSDMQFEHNLSENVDGSAFVNHDHVSYEILYILRGSGVFLIEDSAYEFAPQSLFLIPFGKYHYMKKLPTDTYDRCVVNFSAELVPPVIAPPKALFLAKPSAAVAALLEKFDRYAESFGGEVLHTLYASLLSELLILLSLETTHLPETLQVPPLVARAIAYINDHLDEPIRMETLAGRLYCSPSRLHHAFSETMGTSVVRYARMKKMYRARELLQSGASAQRTAELLGYDDYPTFYKNYRSVFHASPSEQKNNGL